MDSYACHAIADIQMGSTTVVAKTERRNSGIHGSPFGRQPDAEWSTVYPNRFHRGHMNISQSIPEVTCLRRLTCDKGYALYGIIIGSVLGSRDKFLITNRC